MDQPMCKTCRWWDVLGSVGADRKQGQCRRNPPMMAGQIGDNVGMSEIQDARWPLTSIVDWCGEYKPPPDSANPPPSLDMGIQRVGLCGLENVPTQARK